MKLILFLFSILYITQVQAWTLNPSTSRAYANNEINIEIASDDCSAAGFSTAKYKTLIQEAVDEYWHQVPTSSLYLKVQGVGNISLNGDTHSTAINKVTANTILAGCNNDATDFSNTGILGSAVMTCSGETCYSVLILNTNSVLSTKSDSYIKAVIAHEIGHAFGLGHSEYQYNLMYYNISGKTQEWLGMDDVNGVSYLYPHESDLDILGISLLGNCGTINLDGDGGGSGPSGNTRGFVLSFLLGLLALFFFKVPSSLYRRS